jgi:hypothetical protein
VFDIVQAGCPFCHNLAVSGGFFQAQGVKEVELLRLLSGESCLGGRANARHMLLNALKQIEGGARTCAMALCLQPYAHDAVEDEGQEADHGVSADTVREPVMNRRDLDVGFQDEDETALAVLAPVAGDAH